MGYGGNIQFTKATNKKEKSKKGKKKKASSNYDTPAEIKDEHWMHDVNAIPESELDEEDQEYDQKRQKELGFASTFGSIPPGLQEASR